MDNGGGMPDPSKVKEEILEDGEMFDVSESSNSGPELLVKNVSGPRKRRKRNKGGNNQKAPKIFRDDFDPMRQMNQGNFDNDLLPQVIGNLQTLKNVLSAISSINNILPNSAPQRNDYKSSDRVWENIFNSGRPSTSNNFNHPTNSSGNRWDTQSPKYKLGETSSSKKKLNEIHSKIETAEPHFLPNGKEMKNANLPKGLQEQDPTKREGSFKATHKIPIDDPYWKPCFTKLPHKTLFLPGIFYIDQFMYLADKARVKLRSFEDGTLLVIRKGESVILRHPENGKKVAQIHCEQCSRKTHTIHKCIQVICCLCKKNGHVATRCTEPELGDFCLGCRETDHNHNERSLCARKVHIPRIPKVCTLCGRYGHGMETCKNVTCRICGELGHLGNVCKKQTTAKIAVQDLTNSDFGDSAEAVLRCLVCVRIGKFIYSAELNENEKFSQINPNSVRLEGFDGFSPSLRLTIKIGTLVHNVIFRVNRELLLPISLGSEAMKLFDIRVYFGDSQIGSSIGSDASIKHE